MAVFGGHVPVVTLLLGKITDINRVDNVSHQSLCAAEIDLQCALRNIDLAAYLDQDPPCILSNPHCILSNPHCMRLHTVWMDSSHGGSCVRARSCCDLSPRQRS